MDTLFQYCSVYTLVKKVSKGIDKLESSCYNLSEVVL